MNRSKECAEQIEQDFQDDGYYEGIIPPELDIEENILSVEGEYAEYIRNSLE